jgi:hypothetical protein
LQIIEKILLVKLERKQTLQQQKDEEQLQLKAQIREQRTELPRQKMKEQKPELAIKITKEIKLGTKEKNHHVEQSKLLEQLLKPQLNNEGINPQLLRKKKRKRHHLNP